MQINTYDDEKSPPSTDPKVMEAARKGWEEGTRDFMSRKSIRKRLARLLCKAGFHRWKKGKDVLGSSGMGFDSFETFTCERCPARGNRIKGTGNRFQVENGGPIDRLLWP